MKKILPPISPGEILLEEFLLPLGLSMNQLANAIGVPPNRISAIIKGQRSMTADTALRLSRFFGNSARFWLNLQMLYDLEIAERESGKDIIKQIKPASTTYAK